MSLIYKQIDCSDPLPRHVDTLLIGCSCSPWVRALAVVDVTLVLVQINEASR